ncbi:MAG: hypothetical protein KY468_03930 [Armatimonadetes bacterium]|nr:hypothetical protein [Armatimonadota bacterium]
MRNGIVREILQAAALFLALFALLMLALMEAMASYLVPGFVYLAFALTFSLVYRLLFWRPSKKQNYTVLLTLFTFLAAMHFIPWSPSKPFLKRLAQIEPGMTVAQVEGIMHGYLRGMGSKWEIPPPPPGQGPALSYEYTDPARFNEWIRQNGGRARFKGDLVYRHSNDGAFDSDMGFVNFRKGRVVKVRFMAD